jgi:hypothetical protein
MITSSAGIIHPLIAILLPVLSAYLVLTAIFVSLLMRKRVQERIQK